MQGKKSYQEKLFISFQLSDCVPEENFYRILKDSLDFSFLYKATSKYYGKEGQKSIDPVVFMKLMLVGYLENINSDRRIINMARMRLDILYFLGYNLDEEFPWHSTLSRTRQLYGQEVFTELFKRVLKQCIDKQMVAGKRQAVDGVYIKANASLDSMVERDILNDAEDYSQELESNVEEVNERVERIGAPDDKEKEVRPLRNKTHYSSSDPEAKISVKRGKQPALNYLGQISVDTASHVITHVQAFTADKRDGSCLAEMLDDVITNLGESGLAVEEIVADAGFSTAEALKELEQNNIIGYIPNRPQFVAERPGFIYEPEGDYYTCPNNEKLVYKGTNKTGADAYSKEYRVSKKTCRTCPLQSKCSVYGKRGAKIRDSVDRAYYERMHDRMKTKRAKWIMKERQSTVEPVIGTLVNYLGMKRVNTKGVLQANKCLTMAAVAYNLKKLLKYNPKKVEIRTEALRIGPMGALFCPLASYCNIQATN